MWIESEAKKFILDHKKIGLNQDIALRVYTSRLIGKETHLVIHGGGNTSVKTKVTDFLGHQHDVLCVKGSGWDLSTIEAKGLPALKLAPLKEARGFNEISDEDMVKFLRSNLLDPASPNPSVETLLHAFLPHKFIDHSHAAAILSLTDQSDGNNMCRDIFGKKIAIVPYIMPGFLLAKRTADVLEKNPDVEGLILQKHGLFTFGDTAKISYDRMIDLVTLAEEKIKNTSKWTPAKINIQSETLPVSSIAPFIRGACTNILSNGETDRFILDFRTSKKIQSFVNGRDLKNYGVRGVITPDHVIRTKNKYLISPIPTIETIKPFEEALREQVEIFRENYDEYFELNNLRHGSVKKKLDSAPRVILVPTVGLFGAGRNAKEAKVAADLAEITIDTIINAERIGTYEALNEAEIFDMEYWSLEQAKLNKRKPLSLAGQVAVITGAAGTIG